MPSVAFKKEVSKSILAIIGFIFIYIALFLFSLALVAACLYGGLALMLSFKWLGLLVGAGMIGLSVMVFVFLIKFLFATSTVDESDSIEITANDQPELIAFIHQVAEETKTPKPKRILLSSDVNACVFYHSSFWSMFFPVKKNLKIGLGLINAVNKSELKAVIAHEFGHFSQRSMKLGSYTYHVNKIIHDMLYNNSGYGNTLSSWSEIHGVFHLFAQITVHVVKAIQWVLLQGYKMVNKSYLGLSRQMEFHADLVAASVSGSNNIISALRRIEVADACYSTTLGVCDKVWKENKVVEDVYAGQSLVLEKVAEINHWSMLHGLPVINENSTETVNRVTFTNQWASHPTTKERKAYLDQYDLGSIVDHTPGWALVKEQAVLRVRLTKLIYRQLSVGEDAQLLDAKGFEAVYNGQLATASFPSLYNGFYNNRVIATFDTDPNQAQNITPASYEEVLTPDALALPGTIEVLLQDIEVLGAIAAKQIDTKTFDFDGQKYKRSKAVNIQQVLEQELTQCRGKLAATDMQLYLLSYKKAPLAQAEGLRKLYDQYFTYRQQAEQLFESINAIMQSLQPIYAGQTLQLEEINLRISRLKEVDEVKFKEGLQYWLSVAAFDTDAKTKKKIEAFIPTQYQYFSGNSFFDTELVELSEVVQESWNGIDRFLLTQFKAVLEHQALYLEPSAITLLRAALAE